MIDDRDVDVAIGVAIVVAVAALVLGVLAGRGEVRKQAVEAGVGCWDPATKEFKWIKVETKPSIKE